MLTRAWITLFSVALVGSGCLQADEGPPAITVKFYQRLEKFDTAGMMELVCPTDRETIESSLGVLQALQDFRLTEVPVDRLELVDFELRELTSSDSSATVHVEGRLLAGPPLGSASLDEDVVLRREEDGWCMTSDPSESSSSSRRE